MYKINFILLPALFLFSSDKLFLFFKYLFLGLAGPTKREFRDRDRHIYIGKLQFWAFYVNYWIRDSK